MKKTIPLSIALFLTITSYAQESLLQNAKLRLIDDFHVYVLDDYELQSYCSMPLKFELLKPQKSKGFDGFLFAMIPEQVLCFGKTGAMFFTPLSTFIDSPCTNSFFIAIDQTTGRVFRLAGFAKNDVETLIYYVSHVKYKKSQVNKLNSHYKIDGFHFHLFKNQIQLIPDLVPYRSSTYMKAAFDSVTNIFNKGSGVR